ncbi:uncharacterized protein STAUR_1455 [Stigmatella aurantiaca DW4/3-1]|nr:uncharacterized protein STAUR_1455 [Stigmatella aurantiaca DW4/3-1]
MSGPQRTRALGALPIHVFAGSRGCVTWHLNEGDHLARMLEPPGRRGPQSALLGAPRALVLRRGRPWKRGSLQLPSRQDAEQRAQDVQRRSHEAPSYRPGLTFSGQSVNCPPEQG